MKTKPEKVFQALSDMNRIRILKMLEVRPLCVCEITSVLNLATSTVSKHLSILRDADLLRDRKDGKWIYYELNKTPEEAQVKDLLSIVSKWLEQNGTITADRKKAKSVDKEKLCGV